MSRSQNFPMWAQSLVIIPRSCIPCPKPIPILSWYITMFIGKGSRIDYVGFGLGGGFEEIVGENGPKKNLPTTTASSSSSSSNNIIIIIIHHSNDTIPQLIPTRSPRPSPQPTTTPPHHSPNTTPITHPQHLSPTSSIIPQPPPPLSPFAVIFSPYV